MNRNEPMVVSTTGQSVTVRELETDNIGITFWCDTVVPGREQKRFMPWHLIAYIIYEEREGIVQLVRTDNDHS